MVKRQSRFDIWSSSNKRDNGFSKNSNEDLISTIKTSKQQELESIKASITDSQKVRMKELLNISKSQIEFMSRMEDENLNVMYLVALGITSEEDVQSYQTLRDRGIDTYGLQDTARQKNIDNDYYREIMAMKKEYPDLLNISGENIQNKIDKDNYIKSEAIFKQDKPKDIDYVEVDKSEYNDVASVEIDLDSLEQSTESQKSTTKEIESAKNWKDILSGSRKEVTERVESSEPTVNGSYFDEYNVQAPQYRDLGEDVRQIFILAEEFPTPVIEGYKFIFVKDSSFLSRFAINKNNLLILTRDIPEYLINDFASWLEGILNADEKFRIATIQTSPIEHPVVQETLLRLDKTNLDNFYNNHNVEDYISDTTGTFLDLSSMVEDDYELE